MRQAATESERNAVSWPPASAVIDVRSNIIDVTGDEWLLPEPTVDIRLQWNRLGLDDDDVLRAIKRYFAWMITAYLPFSVRNAFQA